MDTATMMANSSERALNVSIALLEERHTDGYELINECTQPELVAVVLALTEMLCTLASVSGDAAGTVQDLHAAIYNGRVPR